MEHHTELTNEEFIIQLESCELDPAIFNHEAHLRLAWIILKKFGPERSVEEVERMILKFVASVGAMDKYNKTLTVSAVQIVNHFIGRSKSDNFTNFISEFPRLKSDFKGLIKSHYSFDIFTSEKAKTQCLAPDLLPFV